MYNATLIANQFKMSSSIQLKKAVIVICFLQLWHMTHITFNLKWSIEDSLLITVEINHHEYRKSKLRKLMRMVQSLLTVPVDLL